MLHRRRRHTDDDGDEIVEDGGIVKVPLFLADAGPRSHISDALAMHNKYAGHRPGYVADALTYGRSELSDASNDLIDRRGTTLDEAKALRDQAFSDLCKRSQSAWRRKSTDADPDGDGDNDEPPENGDEDGLVEARRKRDEAFAALEQRSQNAWRTSPAKATATELQGERWRGGK